MRGMFEEAGVRSTVIVACALLAFSLVVAPSTHESHANEPPLIILEGHALAQVKRRLQAGDAALTPSLNKLKRDADRALLGGPFSVTEKSLTPPSGDKHDYMSIAPYWWPNPNTAKALCYPTPRPTDGFSPPAWPISRST